MRHDPRNCCTEHGRAAAPAPACPRSSAACPSPAGTGLSRRSLLLRSAGLGARRLRRRASWRRRRLRGGRRARAAAAGRAASCCSVFLDGGVDALSVPGAGRRPGLPPAAAEARAAPTGRARRSPRTRGWRWHPAAAGARRPARRGQGHRPARGRLHPPGPVALHLAPLLGGRRAGRRACDTGWMGRVLDRVGTPDNPLQGVVARRPARAGARRRRATRSPRSTTPADVRLLDARARGAARRRRCVDAFTRSAARDLRSGDPARRPGRPRRGVRGQRAARRSRRSARTASPPTRRAGRLPADRVRRRSRRGSRASPRCSPPACRSAARPINAPGAYDTHANQAETLPEEPRAHRRRRCWPSSATSRRAASPTASSRSCGRSSAAARRRTARAPTTARRASAS